MDEQRRRAKADAAAKKTGNLDVSVLGELLERSGTVEFTGYDGVVCEARAVGLLAGGASVASAEAGDEVEVVLDRTPFYAEGGGQLADHGVIRFGGGAEVEVVDVQSPLPGLVVHRGRVRRGEARAGETVHAEIDVERRRAIS